MSGGGVKRDSSHSTKPRTTPRKEVQRQLEAELEQIEQAEMVYRAERETENLLGQVSGQVDWKLTDHGQGHVSRVREATNTLVDTVNETSIAGRALGHLLSDDEAARLETAAVLHDIGRGLSQDNHAAAGAEYIRSRPGLISDEGARNEISKLVELHSKTELRRKYGSADLETLVSRGAIDQELAVKASLLRLADGLDADRRRAEANTQGQSYADVKQRLNTEASQGEREVSLAHWEGHRGIEHASIESSGDKLAVKFRLSPSADERHSADVAFKVLDVLHEVQTTPLKHHAEVVFQSTDPDRLRRWYDRNREGIAPGLKGLDVYFERVDGD